MKKKYIIILATMILSRVALAQDKAFQKGDIEIDLGAGISLYKTYVHWESNPTPNTTFKVDTTDAAGAFVFPLNIEYGVTNWLGIGGHFLYANYIEEKDSAYDNAGTKVYFKPKVRGIDADITLNFHLVKTKSFDMPIQLIFGYTNIKFENNDPLHNKSKDNGINYGVNLQPRIYFGKHFGMYINLGYAGYKYPSLEYSNDLDSNLNDNFNTVVKFKGNGGNLGIGFMAKF